MQVINLKTEYKTNPIGLGVLKPRLSWQISSEKRNIVQTAYQIKAADSAENLKNQVLVWDSGKVESDQSIHIAYDAPTLISRQSIYWQVTVWDNQGNEVVSTEKSFFEMGFLETSDWQADWITSPDEPNLKESEPCPYLAKSFSIDKPIAKARIYASALGLYELELNGQKVGDEVFAPGWTNYRKRIQYQVYDVTDQLKEGENVIGGILGDGWFRGHMGWWDDNRNTYGDHTALILQFEVEFEDGTKETITTDDSWKIGSGPILESDIYNGEIYDARLELPGWSESAEISSDWKSAKILDHSKEILIASEGEKVRKTKEIKPIELFITPAGEKVFDLGQNMVGWVRLKVQGEAGAAVKFQFAEVLDQEGNFYIDNLRGIKCTDTYILSGKDEETYKPRFTFHGFRYVKVEGYPGELSLESITGIVVHSDMPQIGHFECSHPLINQLQSNIEWGQRGNFLDVPTDCPQRDERLGWTGDAQVFAPTASFNFNTAPFFTKWLADLESEQREDGSVPWVVPNNIKDGGGTGWSDGFGATGWADAAVIIPWTLYQSYGDSKVLERQFESMLAWVKYMTNCAGESCIFEQGFHFGDWLSFAEYYSYQYNAPDYGYAGAHTDKALIATAYFYRSTEIVQKTAELLGRELIAQSLAELLPKIKLAWNKEFVTPTGRLVSSTQAAYAIALRFGLIEKSKIETISKRLADDVSYFGHLTTGFLGTPELNFALSDFGHLEQAFDLLNNERYPSWLYAVTQGATTIWERWDGIKPDGTFQTVGMNSFNHYAYGAIGDWLYSRVAGIQIDEANPGYKRIIFEPHIGGGLTHAKAELETMYGKVLSGWKIEGDLKNLKIEIPANCTGVVKLREAEGAKLKLDGQDTVDFRMVEEKAELILGSGEYDIEW